jgi:hypothetical protein
MNCAIRTTHPSKAGGFTGLLLFGVSMATLMMFPSFRAAAATLGALLPVPTSTMPSNGDNNPYGIVIVNGSPGGLLKNADNLVSNFNATIDGTSVMGTGTTIVDIRNGVQESPPFYTAPATFKGVDLAFGQLGTLFIIGNVPVSGTKAGAGALTVLNSSGTVLTRLADPKDNFIDGPWGLAINSISSTSAQLFVSNLINGTVWRLDVTVGGMTGISAPTSETRVGAGYSKAVDFPSSANGPAGLAFDSAHDILYVASEQDNKIFEIKDASTITTNQSTPGIVVYADEDHLHGPTGLIYISQNGHLLTANDDGINMNSAEPSEIVEFVPEAPTGEFVTQYSVDPLNGGSFGVARLVGGTDNLRSILGYVDDNTVTYSFLSLYFGTP